MTKHILPRLSDIFKMVQDGEDETRPPPYLFHLDVSMNHEF